MEPKGPDDYDFFPWVNPVFIENQRNFPPTELDKYRGLQIAWSWDGGRIVASGRDHEDLDRNLQAAGIDAFRVIYDYVDDL